VRKTWYRTRSIAALLALLGWLAPGPANAKPSRDAPAIEKGLLWVIARDGRTLGHLFGTFHLPVGGRLAGATDPVRPIVDGADTAVFEIDFASADAANMTATMYFTDGRRLDGLLAPGLFEQARRRLAALGMPASSIQKLKPWAVGVLLSLPEALDGEPMDRTLQRRARAGGGAIVGLETVGEQLALFDGLPMEEQVLFAEQVVRHPDRVAAQKAEMIEAYLDGDLESILALTETAESDMERRFVVWFRDKVLVRRNHSMFARLRDLLPAGGLFIAVGALHLPGADGLVRLLRRAGYDVRPVK